MDPRFLERDEVEVELEIRGIKVSSPQAIDILFDIIEQEVSGLRMLPQSLHSKFRTVGSEISELEWKLASIIFNKGDVQELAKCHARLLHIYGRLVRLEPKSGGHKSVGVLRDEVRERLSVCSNLLKDQIGENMDVTMGENIDAEANRQAQGTTKELQAGIGDSASNVTTGSTKEDPAFSTTAAASNGAIPKASSIDVAPIPYPVQVKPVSALMATPTVSSLLAAKVAEPSPQVRPAASVLNPNIPLAVPQSNLPSFGISQPQALPPQAPNNVQPPSLYQQANVSQGWTMGKWPLRFSGGSKDLPADEFIFRAETLARLSNLPQAALTLGLHQLLTGAASSWYWVFLRTQPNATWADTRRAIINAFQINQSDAAIRRQIMDRLQRPGERFMEYQLAIQELELRLANRMSEAELLETLRRNLLPHIQDRLLFVPIYSVYDLQSRVHQVEELAQRQLEVQHLRRPAPRIHEIIANPALADESGIASCYSQNFTVPPPPMGVSDWRSNPFAEQMGHVDINHQFDEQQAYISAIGAAADRNQYILCWNCDEMGHTFMDCAAQRSIFCYGCGAKNVVRPQCAKCSVRALQGNGRGSVRPFGTSLLHPRPSLHQSHRPDFLRRPQ